MPGIRAERLDFGEQERNVDNLNYSSEEKKVFKQALDEQREIQQGENPEITYNISGASPSDFESNKFIMLALVGYFLFC